MAMNASRPHWDSLPFEIRTLIINSIIAPQDLRRAWFTCRLVSRSFKTATEEAFKVRIVPDILMLVKISCSNGLRVVLPKMNLDYSCLQTNIVFNRFSENGTHAILEHGYGPGEKFPTDEGLVPLDQVQIKIDKFWLPFYVLAPLMRNDIMKDYINRTMHNSCVKPSLYRSRLKFVIPYINHMSVDCEKNEVSVPYSPIVSWLLAKEMEIDAVLELEASKDLEKTHWHVTSRPSVEQGLRIALRSEVVRIERFETSMNAAVTAFRKKRQRPGIDLEWCRDCENFGFKLENLNSKDASWYDEWAGYVGI
ncbi:hypothetical protein F4781DRAFT_438965 [Annulohypoxylon bovei var. microspora]|nr:hypothetical protein F4781DRAFT_438965 [Annulohypoxylon bovei var. microspora]